VHEPVSKQCAVELEMALVQLAQAVPVLMEGRTSRELQAGQRSKNRLKQKLGRDRGTVNEIAGGTRNVRRPDVQGSTKRREPQK
jgi:hypothetical protein